MPARRLNILSNLLLLLLLVGLVAASLHAERKRRIVEIKRDAINLAGALAAHSSQTLVVIDQQLRALAAALDPATMHTDGQIAPIHALLSAPLAATPGVLALTLLDARGRALNSSRTPERELTDLSQTELFQRLRDESQDGLAISLPVVGSIGHARDRWVIPIGRRLAHPDGRFAGVVTAVLAYDIFETFHASLEVGERGVVGLVRADGRLIARTPFDPERVGEPYTGQREIEARSGQGARRGLRVVSQEAVERLVGLESLEGFGLTAFVALDLEEQLASWRATSLAVGGATLAFVLAMLLQACALDRAIMRRDAARAALVEDRLAHRAEQERYQQQLAGLAGCSAQFARIEELPRLLQAITDAARGLIDCHQATTSLTRDAGFAQAINGVSLSERYAAWKDYDAPPADSGIYRLVCQRNQPMRLSQEELQAHPAYRGFGAEAGRHPPLRGWMAAPLIGRGGHNLGLIQLSDRDRGDFTENDLAILIQLAHIAATAVENARLHDELSQARMELARQGGDTPSAAPLVPSAGA